ncbi:DUF4347 domain-containing protein [Azospirillum rugosum]|uniref:Ca2+-binding RTX toxin-like protein n=1 Tax=Azospirillum rugosum TaxID=416170 RepID=A0ABS4SN25_9PROT|nr:DUF4347 domain-containing protein [Azospirillum rugosum]MBP2293332.1 Ca2+-binding RTX toxin-like protein [Azospirillum rugosum]
MDFSVTPLVLRPCDPAINGGRKEAVFIDASLADWQALAGGVAAGIEVVLLDGSADGLAQMAAWAADKEGYDAIHVLSHGAEGQVRLGTLILDAAAVQARSAELGALGGALTDEGDLLLYGCDVASGNGGPFIAALADATGADVAASANRTGGFAVGGNWILETVLGSLEASPLAFESYAHALDTFTGTAGNDPLTGTAGADTLSGLAGNDTLSGGDGNDSLVGGDGNDLLYGDAGNDTIQGGNGDDTIQGGEDNDTIVGGAGNDSIIGGAGNDVIGYTSGSELGATEFIDTGDGNDIIRFYSTTPGDTLVLPGTLTDSNNTLIVAITGGYSGQTTTTGLKIDGSAVTLSGGLTMNGGGGSDVLTGTAQNDSLKGGNGDDTLNGGAGNDTLNGEAGTDVLNGGAGNDVFLDPNGDVITTLESGDIIRLTGGAAQNLASSHLQYNSATKTLTVDYDKNGTFGGGTDVVIVFTNAPALTSFQVTNNSPFADIKLAALNSVPVNTANPTVSGTATVGNALSTTTGTWTDSDGDSLSYTYKWYRADDEYGTNATTITGATSTSYTLTTSDAHKYLRVVVTANDGNGGTQVASSAYTAITNSAPVNSLVPTVTGTATVGNALSTSNGTWSDADGDGRTYSYQWYRANSSAGDSEAAISGATASSYTPVAGDLGKYLRVVVTANDGNGGTQTATSTRTAIAGGNGAPVNSAVPVVSGTATVGNALSATTGTWTDPDGDSLGYTYQWYRADDENGTNATAITGATSTGYSLTTTDAHKYLRVVVTANDGNGGTQTASSAYTTITNSAPVNSVAPTVTGTAAVGNALSTSNGVWSDPDGDGRTYSYQWYRADDGNGSNAAAITGATSTSYSLTTSDAHKYLRVVVTANDGKGGTQTATSAFKAIDNSAPSLTAPLPISLTDTAIADSFAPQTGTLGSADADGDARTYGITGGTAASFTSNGLTYDLSMAGTYGTLHLDSATGRYVYVPADGAINALTASASETFTVTVSDGALSDSKLLTVTIAGANEAPVMSADVRSLTGIDEDASGNDGDSVAGILASAGTATDADGNALGIAVTAVDNSNGTWEYKPGTGSWTAITGASGGSALLLAGTDRVRFVPNANYNGSATGGITFKAWDQTSGTAGTTAGNDTTANGGLGAGGQYSAGSATAGVAVAAVNDAPVLSDTVLVLPGVAQAAGAPSGAVGAAVSSLVAIGTNVTDVDSGAVTGIALVGVDTSAGGTWYYSTDGGANWAVVGTVNDSGSALLLRTTDRLYYQPTGGNAGLLIAAITFRAWDQSAGTAGTKVATGGGGGASAFSAATDTASLSIAPGAPGVPDLAAASDTGGSNTDNITKAGSVTVTGSGAAANATVRLYADGTLRATAAADAAGAYSFADVDVSGLGGPVNVTVRQVVGGAESGDSGGLTVTFDRTAPTVAIGTVAGDDRISAVEDQSAVAVSGTTSGVEDGQMVTVTVGGVTKTATVNANAWTVSLTSGEVQGLTEGSTTITAAVSDLAGNAATPASRSIVYDRTAPSVAIGSVAGDDRISGVEDHAAVAVSGITSGVEDGQTVTVTVGGVTKTATVSANAWTVSLTGGEVQSFAEGPLTITAAVSDAAGNAAAPASRTVTYDRTAPTAPTLLGVFTDAAATAPVTVTNDTTLVVRGTAEAGSRVEVSDNGTLLATVVAGADGSWTAALGSAPLADGRYALTATATDAAGNRSPASAVSTVLVDTQAPGRPTVGFSTAAIDRSTQTSVSFQISGGEAGSTVRWTLSSAGGGTPLTGTGTLTDGGSLTVGGLDVSGLYDGTLLLSLTASDAAGNSAPAATASVAKATAVQVDGVPVQTLTTQNAGRTVTTVVVQAPSSGRVEDPSTSNAGLADVPVVQETVGGTTATTLSVGLSAGIGMTASGTAARQNPTQSLAGLIRAIEARTDAGSSSRTGLTDGGSGFLKALSEQTQLLVRSIDFSAPDGTAGQSVQAKVAGSALGGNTQASATPTAVVLNTSGVNAPVTIQLDNIQFAAVIGNATLVGGEGEQVVYGDAGRQWLYLGAGDDELHGGAGDDTVASAGGNDTLFGDDGNDVVMGGEGDDWVLGGAGDDLIGGGIGNDRGFGGTGNDILFGEAGDDTLTGEAGNDTVVGGAGNDLLFGEDGADFLVGEAGNDTLNAGAGNDTALGGDGSDLIGLGDGNDLASGEAGNDTVLGEAGNDTLFGGLGDDLLNGGAGDDLLFADGGADTLWGGAGRDVFALGRSSGGTVVADFRAGEDRLAFTDPGIDLGAVIRSARVEGGNTTLDLGNGGRITILGQTGLGQTGDIARWFA